MDKKDWPQLYAEASTGKIKTWQISVAKSDDGAAIIYTKHGYVDGKLQVKPKKIETGKNIGRANETTPFEQACSEAESTFKKKIAKKYILEIPNGHNAPEIYLPMLAYPFKKYGHKIVYPAIIQPKLNGVRCLARKVSESIIEFTSKTGKSYNAVCQHLVNDLLSIMKVDEIFDGELYVHNWTFQQILRRTKKLRDHLLQYWVYDVADDKLPSTWRNDRYINAIMCLDTPTCLVATQTTMAANKQDIKDLHKNYVRGGFEGTIIRNINENYTFGHRSHNLQKLKDFIDKEYKIVGCESENITQLDQSVIQAAVFVCEINEKQQFSVRPRGTVEMRRKWFDDFENIKNKPLTVRYFELSEDGVPIFPAGIMPPRDYE